MTGGAAPLLAAAASGETPEFMHGLTVLVVAAAVVAYLAIRARQVPMGFLAAGVLIGPNALGLAPRTDGAEAAAEIGVVLLLFTIGIEFSLERLRRIRRLVVIGGAARVTLATAVTAGVLLGGRRRAAPRHLHRPAGVGIATMVATLDPDGAAQAPGWSWSPTRISTRPIGHDPRARTATGPAARHRLSLDTASRVSVLSHW